MNTRVVVVLGAIAAVIAGLLGFVETYHSGSEDIESVYSPFRRYEVILVDKQFDGSAPDYLGRSKKVCKSSDKPEYCVGSSADLPSPKHDFQTDLGADPNRVFKQLESVTGHFTGSGSCSAQLEVGEQMYVSRPVQSAAYKIKKISAITGKVEISDTLHGFYETEGVVCDVR